MPTKLVDPGTDKANRCLYEKLDPSNYESGARMVAFRTFHERIVPWIKILNLYYYELMGKQNDKMVSWVDNPQTISPGQKLQSIIIDVKMPMMKDSTRLHFLLDQASFKHRITITMNLQPKISLPCCQLCIICQAPCLS